jgi:hypothetical protein
MNVNAACFGECQNFRREDLAEGDHDTNIEGAEGRKLWE